MDKIKSLLSPGKDKDDAVMYGSGGHEDTSGATGKVTGEGSHFPSSTTTTQPATVSHFPSTLRSTEPGPSATSPTAADTSTSNTYEKSDPTPLIAAQRAGSSSMATSPEIPREESSPTAIGQTTTYSSYPLAEGNKTSSIVDPNSSDPTTFKKPETLPSAGVGEGAAVTAASTAYKYGEERKDGDEGIPGAFPHDTAANPYSATTIDPRVDTTSTSPIATTGSEGGGIKGKVAGILGGLGLGSAAAAFAGKEKGHDSAIEEPPAATETASSTATTSAGQPPAHYRKESIPTTAYPSGTFDSPRAAPPATHRKESIPTTAYPSGTFDSPRATAPPAPHRKESIPTTAYPSGTFDSPKATVTPVGSAQAQQPSTIPEESSHLGRDAAIGGAGVAAIGAAAVSAHDFEKSKDDPVTSTGTGTKPLVDQFADKPYSGIDPNAPAPRRGSNVDVIGTTAAVAGVGAAGAGAAGLAHEERKPSADQFASKPYSGIDPNAPAPRRGSNIDVIGTTAAVAGVGAAGAGAAGLAHEERKPIVDQFADKPYSSLDPNASAPRRGSNVDVIGTTAAVAGVGTAGAGAAALAHEERKPSVDQFADKPYSSVDTSGSAPRRSSKVDVISAEQASRRGAEPESHTGRDAALIGTAGVGAGAVAAHGLSQHDAEKAEKEHAAMLAAQQKEAEKAEKERQKEADKAQKAHEKSVAKEQKKQEKEVAKEEKKQEKAAAKEDKAAAKEEKKQQEEADRKREIEAAAAAGGAGAVGVGAYEATKHEPAAGGITDEEGKPLKGLAAADEADRQAFQKEKKPNIIKRIFRRKKDDGNSTDEEVDEEVDEGKTHDPHAAETVAGVGTVSAGAAGVAAYEATKSHEVEEPTTATSTTPGLTGLAAADAADKQAALTTKDPAYNDQKLSQFIKQDHHGAETAAGVGTVSAGAAGVAAYEATKSHEVEEPTTATSTTPGLTGLAAADAADKQAALTTKDPAHNDQKLSHGISNQKEIVPGSAADTGIATTETPAAVGATTDTATAANPTTSGIAPTTEKPVEEASHVTESRVPAADQEAGAATGGGMAADMEAAREAHVAALEAGDIKPHKSTLGEKFKSAWRGEGFASDVYAEDEAPAEATGATTGATEETTEEKL